MNCSALLLSVLALAPQDVDRAPPLSVVVGEDAPLVVELTGGAELLDLALGSDLWQRLRRSAEVEAALSSKKARRARSGLAMFAGLLDRSSEDAVRTVLGREVAAAVTPRGPDDATIVVAARLESAGEAARLAEVVHQFLTLVAEGDGYDDAGPIRTVNGAEFHAAARDCFLVANDRAALAGALERVASDRDGAASASDRAPGLHARADLEWLRRANPDAALPVRFGNAVASLLVHGFNAAANRASHATAVVGAGADGVDVAVTLDAAPPDDAAWAAPPGESAPPPPSPPGTIAALTFRRDVAEFYARRLELLDPAIEEKVIEFDNVVSIFFGGRSFGEEVLPALGDRLTLLVGAQRFESLPAPPDVRLPGFALVWPIVDEGLTKNDLLVAFQTTIGIVNADRAQKGLSALMLQTERIDGVDVSSARFLLEDDGEARELRMNASPAVTVLEDHLVIGSARDHLLDVVAALRAGGGAARRESTRLDVDGPNVRAALLANRRALVANRMLEEGESREEAEAFWSRADRVLSLLGSATVRLDHAQGATTLRLALRPRADAGGEAPEEGSR